MSMTNNQYDQRATSQETGPIRIPRDILASSGPAASLRVLLIDDDHEALAITERTLAADGYRIDLARSGDEAIRRLQAGSYDVVVSDIWMPGASGLDVLEAAQRTSPDTVVVLVSASPTIETASRAIESGAAFYLCKPVPGEQLRNVMARAATQRNSNEVQRKALAVLGHVQRHVELNLSAEESFEGARNGLRMAFQPIVSAATGEIIAHEALLRSADPAYPGPLAMLGAAETLHKTIELGRTVRARVADALEAGLVQNVFVNLHADDLSDPELGTDADPLTAFAPRVTLELTERREIELDAAMLQTLERLRARGFGIAIDDLGAGYSSLSAVLEVAPDVVKLDASLIRGIHQDARRQRLVHTLVTHYRESGMRVVAEGIEVAEELDVLVAMGCDLIQGFLLGRPAFLEAHRPQPAMTTLAR